MLVAVVTAFVAVSMIAEARISRRHEHDLRARGAIEPRGDVYALMQVAYPASFLAMAAEASWRGTAGRFLVGGALVFGLAKALKWWAMASLGERWTFRVLVLPGVPLVGQGPYRLLRHPNYVAVVGELLGVAAMLGTPWTGAAGCVGFGSLMWMRIQVEERALRPRA